MRTTRIQPARNRRQCGLTLIELMISIGLGLVVMAAMGYVYIGSREAYRTQDSMARIQENGRYALDVMGQDLRMAGYIGCGALPVSAGQSGFVTPVMTASNPLPAAGLTRTTALTGNDGGVGNPDTVTVYKATDPGLPLTAAMASGDDVPIPASPRQFAAGTYFLIADCSKADIFRASSQVAEDAVAIQHGAANNTSANLAAGYGTDAMVFPYEQVVYTLANNPAGNRSLYRAVNGGAPQEVVENVEAMQITYGVDTDNNGAVNAYVTANNVANWSQVLAVRVSLLLRSPQNNVASQAQTYTWDVNNDGDMLDVGDRVTPNDRRLRYVFTSTIGLRNRLR